MGAELKHRTMFTAPNRALPETPQLRACAKNGDYSEDFTRALFRGLNFQLSGRLLNVLTGRSIVVKSLWSGFSTFRRACSSENMSNLLFILPESS